MSRHLNLDWSWLSRPPGLIIGWSTFFLLQFPKSLLNPAGHPPFESTSRVRPMARRRATPSPLPTWCATSATSTRASSWRSSQSCSSKGPMLRSTELWSRQDWELGSLHPPVKHLKYSVYNTQYITVKGNSSSLSATTVTHFLEFFLRQLCFSSINSYFDQENFWRVKIFHRLVTLNKTIFLRGFLLALRIQLLNNSYK